MTPAPQVRVADSSAGRPTAESVRQALSQVAGVTVAAPEPAVWALLDRAPDRFKDGDLVSEGRPLKHVRNVLVILRHDSRWRGRLKLSEFSGLVEVDGEPVSDEAETAMNEWLGRTYALDCPTRTVSEAVRCIAKENVCHPVRDYLEGLTWDGNPRVHLLLSHYLGAEHTDLHAEISRCWMVSCVARVMRPGCKVDTTLVLVGAQGALKSSAFRYGLLPDERWFSDSAIDLHSKDGYQGIRGKWILELAEMASASRAEAGALKAFLSSPVDDYRPSYGRNTIQSPRQTVIVGTTNEAHFLRDPTGSRRFWPVAVSTIRLDDLRGHRDQLWAEAVALYRSDPRWWLTPDMAEELRVVSEAFQQEDAWETIIAAWVRTVGHRFTIAEMLERALRIEPGRQTRGEATRAGILLNGLGCRRERVQRDGIRTYQWSAPDRAGGAHG